MCVEKLVKLMMRKCSLSISFLFLFLWQILCAFDMLVCHDEMVIVGSNALVSSVDFW